MPRKPRRESAALVDTTWTFNNAETPIIAAAPLPRDIVRSVTRQPQNRMAGKRSPRIETLHGREPGKILPNFGISTLFVLSFSQNPPDAGAYDRRLPSRRR